MLSVFWTFALIGLLLGTGISVTLNTGIIIAAAKSLKNGRKVSPPDALHLVMGLVNLLLQGGMTVQGLLFVLYVSAMFIKEVYFPITALVFTLIYFSSWLNVWLSSYYCTSISNFPHQPFLWFRKTMSTSLWPLLLLSAAGSFAIGVSSIWALNADIETNSLDNRTGGSSFVKGTFYFSPFYVNIATILGCFVPFSLTFLSILLTFCSLTRHVKKLKKNYSGFTRQAHNNAIRRMCRMFTLSAVFCISQLMFFPSRPGSSPDALVTISWSLILVYPTADAIVIIQASSKIQKIFGETFCSGKHGLSAAWKCP